MTAAKIPGGYILVARKLLESGIMEKPPLVAKMWLWMFFKASWRDHGNLKRGQFFTSIDRMRDAFSYKVGYRTIRPSAKEIRSAYDFLTKGAMIGITKVTHGMVITILNYDLYQDASNYEGHNEGHNEGTSKGAILRKKEKERNIYRENSLAVLSYLNEKTGKRYRDTTSIEARLKDGGTVDDCRRIIDAKLKDPFFTIDKPHLMNPRTLFRPSHWDTYLNEAIAPPPRPDEPQAVRFVTCPECGQAVLDSDLDGTVCIRCASSARIAHA